MIFILFSVAVLIHIALIFACRVEAEKITGAYPEKMVKLFRVGGMVEKLTAVTFFVYVLLGVLLMISTSRS